MHLQQHFYAAEDVSVLAHCISKDLQPLKMQALQSFIHSFIHLFHIPLIFTDVELVIFIINIVYKQVNIVIPYCNITVNIVDKINIHKLS
jgi:hypothetical protein